MEASLRRVCEVRHLRFESTLRLHKPWELSATRLASDPQHVHMKVPIALARHRCMRGNTATRCLTPRSSGAPTAGHQARSSGTRYMFASPGLASCRRRPLSSNVRQRRVPVLACGHAARPSGLILTHSLLNVAGSLPPLPISFSSISAGPQPRQSASACPRERGPINPEACHHLMPPTWLARERAKRAPTALCLYLHHRSALPNPSLKRSANGRPPGPGCLYAVHFHQPGPGVLPSSPA